VPGGVGPFGLIVMASGDLREHTSVFFRVFRHRGRYMLLMCTDLTRSSTRSGVYKPPYGGFVDVDIEEHESIKLRTLVSFLLAIHLLHGSSAICLVCLESAQIDHSVVESFGAEGRMCITARVYPEHAETSNSHLFVFNNGTGKVEVSSLEAWELATATVNAVGDDGLVVSQSKGESESY
jgi:beta-fructofuranosidase